MKIKQLILATALTGLGFTSLKAQDNNFEIQAVFEKKDLPEKAYLRYTLNYRNMMDSVSVDQGKFTFKGKIEKPLMARIYFDYSKKGPNDMANFRDNLVFYLEPTNIKIQGKETLRGSKVMAGEINEQYQTYIKAIRPIEQEIYDLRNKAALDSSNKMVYRQQIASLETKKVEAYRTFLKDHPNSFFCLDAVQSLLDLQPNPEVMESVFATLDPSHLESDEGKRLSLAVKSYVQTAVGKPVIDFTQSDIHNKPVKTTDFRGKYLLIDFWASWCVPCRAENPHLVAAYKTYQSKGFEILGVSLDDEDKRKDWLKAIETDGLPWTQVSDLKGWKNEAGVLYGIRSIPSNFLIDPQGKIIARNLRGKQVEEKLKEIFGK